jgi:DNA polymerase-3 subunit epsilon
VTAEIFIRLATQLVQSGMLADFSELPAYCPPPKAKAKRSRRELPFDKDRLRQYSMQPGVYFMKNRLGEVLYIGKAKNLRSRLRSYFQDPRRLPPKVVALMQQVAMIDVTVVGSELEALLLEARLIKAQQPFFNKKIKNYKRMTYLKVTVGEAFPQLSGSGDADDPTAVYFGPFGRESSLHLVLDILNRVFQLRSCNAQEFAAHSAQPCMKYSLGLCGGPCAGLMEPSAYRARVEDFIRFLAGEHSYTVEGLIAKRDTYAETLQFEKAALIQERLALLENVQWRSYRLIQAVTEHNAILVLPDTNPQARRLLALKQGQPFAWLSFSPPRDAHDGLERFVEDWLQVVQDPANRRHGVDKLWFEEARLVSQWLQNRTDDDGAVIFHKNKDKARIMGELWLALTPETYAQPDSSDDLINEFSDEAWEWEQSLSG